MIIYFLGQPCSGKTTLAQYFYKNYYASQGKKPFLIDGDKMRNLYNNKDYSKDGRIANLNKSSDLAIYLHSEGYDVLMSLVCPYVEAREYLESKDVPVVWVCLDYEKSWDFRGREDYHVKDFDKLSASNLKYFLEINTTQLDIKDSYQEVVDYLEKIKDKLSLQPIQEQYLLIRYNTNYPQKSDKKWRILVNGEQKLVDEIKIYVPCSTTQDYVLGDDGQQVEKFHISCVGKVDFVTDNTDKIIATIN